MIGAERMELVPDQVHVLLVAHEGERQHVRLLGGQAQQGTVGFGERWHRQARVRQVDPLLGAEAAALGGRFDDPDAELVGADVLDDPVEQAVVEDDSVVGLDGTEYCLERAGDAGLARLAVLPRRWGCGIPADDQSVARLEEVVPGHPG